MTIEAEYTDEELAIFAAEGTPTGEAPAGDPAPEGDAPAGDPAPEGDAPPAPEGDAPPAPEQQENRMVPHAALHAERVKAGEAQRQLAAATARLNAILASQATSQQQEQPDALPNIEEDPKGYVEALAARVDAINRQTQLTRAEQVIDEQLERDNTQFASFTPDFPQASMHWVQSRATELMWALGGDKAKVQQAMVNEVRTIAKRAWDQGVPASQVLYDLAKARGYTPAAAPAPEAAKGPTAAAVVAAARAGQGASRPMAGTGGTASPTALNAEALLNMNDDEFEAYMKLGSKGANDLFATIAGR